ncbi:MULTISPECIES: hypothetical protein [unclassified Staphylococcus]|uniref:hypothetical protein n=1 Tax=unclassified Staphylococcus TaxID=91994 RepID=UPI0021CEC828|nr:MULTISPECIES: hypothetical protein [unclassified Staphylococcus]UXR69324.1 hypothetical protein MUA26_09385 [Staphylococcus sp. IVB6246]UXR71377.1 hypothetical protein MUA88_09405 [Staphylococcus sp. IVB6240]UXR73655.1 hypothetical protein MUA48_09905 [Staphylococcus sp. IVB6238]UXR75972.1 hypothetical protein MUA74_09990 [Staphylococcus sp. IVB6233]UXR80169.1 hypothetical protein MUA65_09595 [Staphylococcus sp. IVB6218]
MNFEQLMFFIVIPLCFIAGNLVIAPRRQRHIPMRIHVLSCVVGLVIYAIGMIILYQFFL